MDIKKKIKNFIIAEFLSNTDSQMLSDDLNLLSNGIMDSLAVLKLVAYMENEFAISLEPEEIDMDNLNSIQTISDIVQSKIHQTA